MKNTIKYSLTIYKNNGHLTIKTVDLHKYPESIFVTKFVDSEAYPRNWVKSHYNFFI